MRINKTRVITGLILCALAVTLFGACGAKQRKNASGAQEKWGKVSVFVPETMFLEGGTMTDPSDEHVLWLKDKADPDNYITVTLTDAGTAKNDIGFVKTIEECQDVEPFKTGKTTWTGVSYKHGYDDCFTVYTEADNVFEVNGYGYAVTDDTVQEVLSSIRKA